MRIFLAFSLMVSFSVSSQEKSRFEKLELINRVLFLIETQYYRKVDVEKIIEGAVNGMLGTLDPHSVFLNEDLLKRMNENTEGQFEGLGIEVAQKDGIVIVVTPIEDTPAQEAGIMPGDKILEIDEESTIGLSLQEVVDKMRGGPKTKVTLGIMRNSSKEMKYITLTRRVIKTRPAKYELLNDQFFYIRLTQFSKGASKGIQRAIKKMRKQLKKGVSSKGIILDLRYNPGGLLDEAIDIASIFMNDGVVVSTEQRDPKKKNIYYVKKSIFKETTLPMVVLINAASASAAEIVAGALQDSHRALIMGSTSFGKGTVQTMINIDEKSGVKLTIAQYMTPSNRKIQAIGIQPDIFVFRSPKDWREDQQKDQEQIREKNLMNYLTATIETQEEKERRTREIKKKRKNYKEKTENIKKIDPKSDYMVYRAINYLDSFKKIEKVISGQ